MPKLGKEEQIQQIPPKPTEPCQNCKGIRFWLRNKGWGKPEWLCQRCRPCPYDREITWYDIEEEDNEKLLTM